jgi:DNA polymerase-3 subunit delta'
MAFNDCTKQVVGVKLLQRSLERGRVAHAYLFVGHVLQELETLARTLAKTLNCQNPVKAASGRAIDCCDACMSCRKIEHGNHADVHWARPESKTRVITVEQMTQLMRQIQLRPTEAAYKLGIIIAADRLRTEAANAFLKTLEEPPPQCVLILVTTEPQRVLETIRSRCLRLNLGGDDAPQVPADQVAWLEKFSAMAGERSSSLLARYRLLDLLLGKLTELKTSIEGSLSSRSPLEQFKDAEKDLREQWEAELAAAVEAEYRRQRADLLVVVQWWLRDVWLESLTCHAATPRAELQPNSAAPSPRELLTFPQLRPTRAVAERLSPHEARENLQVLDQLQSRLHTNVQEALALEVGLLKLHL